MSRLKADHERGEATPAAELTPVASDADGSDSTRSYPELQFVHCCGTVGSNGNVSALAMNHYVPLVQDQLLATLELIEPTIFDAVLLSIAVSPGGERRVEIDFHPNDAPNNEFERLPQKITEIETPLIHEEPIAFAFHIQIPRRDR